MTHQKHGREELSDLYPNKKNPTAARKTRSEEARDSTDESSSTKLRKVSDPASNSSENSPDTNIKFFRTKEGEAYGFAYNGKIYIDLRIANDADTPIHEFTHTWAQAIRQTA